MVDALTKPQLVALLRTHVDACGKSSASADLGVTISTLNAVLTFNTPITDEMAYRLGYAPQILYVGTGLKRFNTLPLTPAEARVAATLAPGDRLTIDHIRELTEMPSNETVRSHIAALRRKGAVIHTQHLQGYRFDGWQ